jgi:hypothetical protein
VSTPPAFVGSPKQGARPGARLCDGVGSAARPRAPGRAPETLVEERSGRACGADVPRFCPLGQNFAESPQLRLALAMLDAGVSIAGEVGARGRAARPTNAGGNCENLQELAGSEEVAKGTNGIVPVIVPDRGDLPFLLREHTVRV